VSNLALAPMFEMSPGTIDDLIARLPARHRAGLAWAPRSLETSFTGPLAQIEDPSRLQAQLPDLLVEFAMINWRLGLALLELGRLPELSGLIADALEERSAGAHEAIRARLDAVDPTAADQLREAFTIARVVVPLITALAFSSTSHARPPDEPSREEMRAEMEGPAGDYLRLVALLGAALSAVRAENTPLPPLLAEWCALAWDAGWSTVDDLRRSGLPVPAISIPGFTRREWRERWASRVLSGLDADALADLDDAASRSETRPTALP
jgi:hypothetical protein